MALTLANENGCNYCNSTHTFFGHKIGLDDTAIDDARSAQSADPKINAALVFAKEILDNRGAVPDAALEALRTAGYTEAEIIEIIAQVSLGVFTNYINIIASAEIDFPKLAPINN